MNTVKRALLLLAFGWATVASAQATQNIYLAQGKVFFQGMEFEKCLQRMEQASRWSNLTRQDLRDIELYTGLCRFSLGQREEAVDHFTLALQLDPNTTLPPATSPKIEEVFRPLAERARAAQAATGAEPGQDALGKDGQDSSGADAPRSAHLVPPTPGPRTGVDAALEPDAPKSRVLPLALGGTAVAAAGAGALLGVLARGHEARFNDRLTYYDDAQAAGKSARSMALGANIAFGIAGAAATGALVTWLLD